MCLLSSDFAELRRKIEISSLVVVVYSLPLTSDDGRMRERKIVFLRTNTAENEAKMETMKKQYSITVSSLY